MGEFEAETLSESSFVDTVISVENIKDLALLPNLKIAKERIPILMNKNRKVLKYEDVVFEVSGKRLQGRFKNVLYISQIDSYISLWNEG